MNKKSRIAQLKHAKRKNTLKERAREERASAGGGHLAPKPARTRYELEETVAVKPVKEPKVKAAPKPKAAVVAETPATAIKPEEKVKAVKAVKPKAEAKPAAKPEEKPKTAKKTKAE